MNPKANTRALKIDHIRVYAIAREPDAYSVSFEKALKNLASEFDAEMEIHCYKVNELLE